MYVLDEIRAFWSMRSFVLKRSSRIAPMDMVSIDTTHWFRSTHIVDNASRRVFNKFKEFKDWLKVSTYSQSSRFCALDYILVLKNFVNIILTLREIFWGF